MTELSYEQASRYVLELPLHTKKNPFQKAKAFYEWLGGPGGKSRIIHVAGTNGKGSVCAFLHSILTVAGYRTGLFTSPHLVDLRERLVLGREQIEKDVFARLLTELLEKLEEYARQTGQAGEAKAEPYCPTFFEMLFFLFSLWMEEEKPDFVILETGMGGLLDVTNVVEKPLVCVITRIALDHCAFLGGTLEEIAAQKAGIFKKGVPAVCWDTGPAVRAVFVRTAGEVSAPLTIVSKNQVAFSKLRKNSVDFFMESAYYKYIEATLQTEAAYQAQNALLAVRAIEAAGLTGQIARKQVESGLCAMRWDGRMEEVLPEFYVDGAHNPDGIAAFLDSVALDGCHGKRLLLFGASADKSVRQMLELLQQSLLFDSIEGCCIPNPRSLTKEELSGLLSCGEEAVYEDPARALGALTQKRGPRDRIYAVGSLYLAGEIKRAAGTYMEVCHD